MLAKRNFNLFFLIQIYDMAIKIYLQFNVISLGKMVKTANKNIKF